MTSPDEGPEWADEAHLDEVFSTWVPGPPDSASAAEKEMAGDNPRMEIPEEDLSDRDIEAALAAALAEAEDVSADSQDLEAPPVSPAPAASSRFEPSEPASPSWLNVAEPEAPGPGTRAHQPIFEPEPEPEPIFDIAPEPYPEQMSRGAPEPVFEVEPEPEPTFRSQPEPEPVFQAQPEPEPAFEPAPPPPEATRTARPWSRSDDDILPDRKGKGRRR